MSRGGLRALRIAEQENPGNCRNGGLSRPKGGGSMVKKMRSTAGILRDTALVTVGWVTFVVGSLVSNPVSVLLMAAARVLP